MALTLYPHPASLKFDMKSFMPTEILMSNLGEVPKAEGVGVAREQAPLMVHRLDSVPRLKMVTW